jgi:3-dehydroquinate synthase
MAKPSDIIIRAGADTYPVVFRNHRALMSRLTRESDRIVVVSNPTVFALHGKSIIQRLFANDHRVVTVMIGDGERYKNQRTIDALYEQFFDIGLSRYDTIVAFGGGVVGDTAGYAASTFKRGVRFIQVPTTLLAMVDASIGGKVGINHRLGKNQIGAFYQPRGVFVEPTWLATLGRREMVEGLAEILKAGFLSSARLVKAATAAAENPEYTSKTKAAFPDLIVRAVRFKTRIVSRDMHDHGSVMRLKRPKGTAAFITARRYWQVWSGR